MSERSVLARGQHAAADGSFQRSAGGAMLRGIALIVVAVVLGVVLLNATDKTTSFTPEPTGESSAAGRTTTTEPDDAGDSTTTTTAPARNPSEVTVLVANGTGGIRGAASRIADTLTASNYVLRPSVNTASAAEGSVVYYAPGYEADAAAVAELLTPKPAVQAMPATPPVASLDGAQLLVVVATDLASAG